MARRISLSAAMALGLQIGAQGIVPPVGTAAHEPPKSVATPDQSAASSAATPDDLLTVHTTPYHPTLQRDPFATPTDAEQTNRGDLVDDIAVKGRVIANGKTLAVVSDAQGKTRTLPIGFKFRDGMLVAIDSKTVTFHQWDPSGLNVKIYRTVVKVYKREEAKR